MKWIFALLFLIPSLSFSVESVPAKATTNPDQVKAGSCYLNGGLSGTGTMSFCQQMLTGVDKKWVLTGSFSGGALNAQGYFVFTAPVKKQISDGYNPPVGTAGTAAFWTSFASTSYSCPPDGKPEFSIGPVDSGGSKVCQRAPKVCLKGAIVRVSSDGKETCVPNCGAAAGLAHSGPYFYQPGPDPSLVAGEIKCYGQCSIQTIGGGVQLGNGTWTGPFTFTGANCSVVRPEPTFDSESNTSSTGDSIPVDNSTSSPGTDAALGDLQGSVSGATGTPVQPDATGSNGDTTLKDVAKAVTDSANAQIKASSEQNLATGKLLSNISKDIQNAIHNTGHGGGGASASLQAQGNGKLDGIRDALGQISDKLDQQGDGDGPFVPGAGSGAFWEGVIPESSFTEIKQKQAESIQKMKDLSTEFQSSIKFTELSASGDPDEWTLNMNGTAMPFGMGAFQLILDMGLAAIVLFICALYAVYIIANRK